MGDPRNNRSVAEPWYSKIAMIAALPLLPAILAYFGLVSYAEIYLRERRTRIHMQRVGRFLRQDDARLRIGERGGTLIIENPTIAWDVTRAWWTPEDVYAESPFPMPTKEDQTNAALEMKCADWDDWCWQNYTNLDDGRAYLLHVWNGAKMKRTVSTWFPGLNVVNAWTGIAVAQDSWGNSDQKKA